MVFAFIAVVSSVPCNLVAQLSVLFARSAEPLFVPLLAHAIILVFNTTGSTK